RRGPPPARLPDGTRADAPRGDRARLCPRAVALADRRAAGHAARDGEILDPPRADLDPGVPVVIPINPAEREALAGEYALGTLDARQARVVERTMATDAAMRQAVLAWQARLSPLAALTTPEVPPPGLWERIEASLAPPPPAAAPAAPPRPSGLWRAWAL